MSQGSSVKPTARDKRIGFESMRYVEHPKSRWHGNSFWLVNDAEAIPARVREFGERTPLSPAKIHQSVKHSVEAAQEGYGIPLMGWSEAVQTQQGNAKLRAPKFAGIWWQTLVALGANEHFLSWIQQHTPEGRWYVIPTGYQLYKTAGKSRTVTAVLMPVRVADVRELHDLPRTAVAL